MPSFLPRLEKAPCHLKTYSFLTHYINYIGMISHCFHFLYCFRFKESQFNSNIGSWDLQSAEDTTEMFFDSGFNSPIGSWNLASVQFGGSMLNQNVRHLRVDCWEETATPSHLASLGVGAGSSTCWMQGDGTCSKDASTFTDKIELRQAVEEWNNDVDAAMMKYGDIGCHWNIEQVDDLSHLFQEQADFNEDLSNWKINHVTNVVSMFEGAVSFNSNLEKWSFGNVVYMARMFKGATQFQQSLSSWDVSSGKETKFGIFFRRLLILSCSQCSHLLK